MATPFPPGIVPNYVDPVSRGLTVVTVSLVFCSIALVFVVARIATRIKMVKKVGWDDMWAILAILFSISRTTISVIVVKRFGLGRHIWDVPPENYTDIRNLQWIEDMVYLLGIMCAKLSILLLYQSIFSVNRKFRLICYGMMAASVIYCIIFLFIYAFDCSPEYFSWHVSLTEGKCIEITNVIIAIGAVNLVTDLIILIMPLPLVWRLNLRRNQKWGLFIIFGTGLFVVITTIVRLAVVVETIQEFDQPWTVVEEINWLTIELNIAIICTSLPALGPLYARFLAATLEGTALRDLLSRSFGSRSRFSRSRTSFPSSQVTGDRKDSSSSHVSNVQLVDMRSMSTVVEGGSEHKVYHEGVPEMPVGAIGLKHTVEQSVSSRDRNGTMV